jgi:hypothetical protein
MDNKKYEQLIELILNENEEQAKELFHEIVVEKSREIYESIMDEEVMEEAEDAPEAVDESMHDGMEEGHPAGQVMDMLDEISAEESGVTEEEEDDADIKFDDEAEEAGDDLTHDLEADHDDEEGDLEDRVVKVEDKLDELMAEFEALMSGDEDMGDEEGAEASDDEEALAEAVQLQKVSVSHGDNGSNPKSVALHEPKVKAAGVNPVKFSGDHEAVPTGPKGPSNEYSKKEGELPGAGKFKNVPGGKAKVDLASAPKPVSSQASGVNTKSPVAKG